MTEEIRLYLELAHRDLEAAQGNLKMGYYQIVVSRAYYAMSTQQVHCWRVKVFTAVNILGCMRRLGSIS
jgi:hypothetical protein